MSGILKKDPLSYYNHFAMWTLMATALSLGLISSFHCVGMCGPLVLALVAGLGGAADVRHRPSEFSERGPIALAELVGRLDDVVREATAALARLSPEQLLQTHRIQGFDVSGLAAIFHSVPHFRGHAQEIVHLTRSQLGEAYRFAWTPQSAEQGAPAD